MNLMNADTETQKRVVRELAEDAIDRHRRYGHDLNTYSTASPRDLWQRGWDGGPFDGNEGSFNWRAWELGRVTRLLVDGRKEGQG